MSVQEIRRLLLYVYREQFALRTFSVVGLDMILGLDYKVKNFPLNIGLDAKPMVDFMDGAVLYFDTGISVRYTF